MKQDLSYFLEKLSELTRETGIVIGGCGCCSSPFLVAYDPLPNQQGQYEAKAFEKGNQEVGDFGFSGLEWESWEARAEEGEDEGDEGGGLEDSPLA